VVVVVRIQLSEDLVVAVFGEETGLPVLGVVEWSEAARADHRVVLGDLPVEELGRSGFGLSAAADTVRGIGHIECPVGAESADGRVRISVSPSLSMMSPAACGRRRATAAIIGSRG
jgi:hypothetical protein